MLEHTAIVPEDRWGEYGPGAVGVGWDGGLLGLTLHLEGGSVGDPMAWQVSEEGRDFFKRSSAAWGEANRPPAPTPKPSHAGSQTRTTSTPGSGKRLTGPRPAGRPERNVL